MTLDQQGVLRSVYDPVAKALRITSAGDLMAFGAGSLHLGTGPAIITTNGVARVALDAAATESVFLSFTVPTAWQSFVVDLVWTNDGAGSGNVRWQASTKVLVNNDLTTEAATVTASTIAAPAQNVVRRSDQVQSITAVTDATYALQLDRLGADGADTLANDVGLIAIRIRQGGV